ncbi:MAG: AraC family transcriptional regulator [Clostridium sp.]|nr:AraC family transcriptional regulator [Clostridium sp.]
MDGFLDLLDKNNIFGIEFLEAFGSKTMSDTHFHDHYELYYQIIGERYFFIKDRFYYIRPGDFVLITKNEIHKTVTANQNVYKRMLINFKTSFVNDILNTLDDIDFSTFFKSSHIFKINPDDENYIITILHKMLDEYEHTSPGYKSSLKLQLSDILIYLSTCKTYDSEGLKFPNGQYNKISKISEYINKNYNKKLTLEHLSKKFSMSPYYLSRTFKDALDITFVEYLNFTRISASKKLILNTNLSMTEIAFEVGFESSTYFTKVFKSITNITPLKFRTLHKKGR